MTDRNFIWQGLKNMRWKGVVLFVSLAINLLLVGLIVGALLAGSHGRDRTALRGLGYAPFVRALPGEDKAALREALARDADSFRHNRAELQVQFESLLAALRKDPFDAGEVERLFAEQRGRIVERQRLAQDYLLERIAAMAPEARAAYADSLGMKFRRHSQ